jgi:hypothetical protein
MRMLLAAIGVLALVTPAAADTLQELTTHGMIMTVQGMDIEVTYKPDGTFTAFDDQITGKWRIDGDKLCTSSNLDATESCVAYPKGKKSGDKFDVTSDQGTASIKIK